MTEVVIYMVVRFPPAYGNRILEEFFAQDSDQVFFTWVKTHSL